MHTLISKVVWIIFGAPFIYLAAVWNQIPARVPMHFDLKGNIDRWGNKFELIIFILVLTTVNIGCYFLLINVHRIDPKKRSGENKERMKSLAFAISLFIAVIICLMIHTAVSGKLNFTMEFIFAAVGILFSVMGNYMYNIKPNYFAGLRLPWTLENEDNWKKTHHLGGKLWFAGGIAIVIASLLLPRIGALIAFAIIMAIIIVIPVIYSYKLFRKQKMLRSH